MKGKQASLRALEGQPSECSDRRTDRQKRTHTLWTHSGGFPRIRKRKGRRGGLGTDV